MKKPVPKASAESVALYDALLATKPEIKRKGATMPYTSVNGNMFSLLTPDGTLALRLPEAERQQWQKLWQEVEALRHQAEAKTKPPTAKDQPQGKEGSPGKD